MSSVHNRSCEDRVIEAHKDNKVGKLETEGRKPINFTRYRQDEKDQITFNIVFGTIMIPTGAGVGAGIGAGFGALGGPIGIGVGAGAGAIIGTIVGGGVGFVNTTSDINRDYHNWVATTNPYDPIESLSILSRIFETTREFQDYVCCISLDIPAYPCRDSKGSPLHIFEKAKLVDQFKTNRGANPMTRTRSTVDDIVAAPDIAIKIRDKIVSILQNPEECAAYPKEIVIALQSIKGHYDKFIHTHRSLLIRA